MKRYFVILLLITSLASCEKEANIKLPEVKPVPVIYCYLSPSDTAISLKLSMSQPLFEKQDINIYDPISDANVTLSSAQGNISLTYDQNKNKYTALTSVYPIIAGQTYKLLVTLNNGTVAEAETTVPGNNIPILAASVNTITTNNNQYLRFKLSFQDDGSLTNYYRVAMADIISFVPNDTTYSETGIRNIYSDAGNNGALMEVNFDSYMLPTSSHYGYMIYLLNTNKDYYLFHQSLRNYQQGNPFAEPSLIYTNIKGGLGVFAASNYTKYRLNQ